MPTYLDSHSKLQPKLGYISPPLLIIWATKLQFQSTSRLFFSEFSPLGLWPFFFDYPESCRLPNSWNGFAPCTTQGFFLVLDKVRYRFKGGSVLGLTHLLRPDAVSWLEHGRPWDPYFGFAVFDSAAAEYTPPVSARCCSPCFGIGRSGATTTQRVPEAPIRESSLDLHVVSDHLDAADAIRSLSPDTDMDPFRLYVPDDDDSLMRLCESICTVVFLS